MDDSTSKCPSGSSVQDEQSASQEVISTSPSAGATAPIGDSTSIGPSICPSVHDDSEQAASQEATACPTTEQGKDRKTALRMYIADAEERFEQKPREAPVDEATLEKLAEARLNISFNGLPINPVILLLPTPQCTTSDRKACHMQARSLYYGSKGDLVRRMHVRAWKGCPRT